jgi:hypothetical protein
LVLFFKKEPLPYFNLPKDQDVLETAHSLPDPLATMAARIDRHSRSRLACQHYLETMLERLHLHKEVGKATTNHARSSIIGYLLYLHLAADPADPDGGASYSRLWSLCAQRDDCGQRVLKTQLAVLRLVRMIRQERGSADRRLALYRPTPKLMEHVTDWYARSISCFDRLNPANNYADRVRADPTYLRHLIISTAIPYFEHNIILVKYQPDFYDLLCQEGGFGVGALMALSEMTSTPLPRQADITRRYGTSASQIRNVLRFIESREMLDRGLQNETRLLSLYKGYIVREMALYAEYALPVTALDEPA